MTFRLSQAQFEGIMELNGTVDFPPGKNVVLHGANQQGKTNVVNALRYAFLKEVKGRSKRRSEYDDRTLPSQDELLFGKQAGITVSFEHNTNSYVLRRTV